MGNTRRRQAMMHDTMRLFALPAIAALVLQMPAVAGAQTVHYDKSRITCAARQMNVPVEARFGKFSAQVAFDPAKPEAGKARVEIDLDSFDIDIPEINREVRGRSWFDTRSFPKATFVSAAIRPLGGGRFEARGPLTLKGRTHEVTAPFTYRQESGAGVIEGGFSIRRLQFNVGDGAWKDTDTVADEVQIRFRFVVSTAPPSKK